mgnify:CR=1 FL=1
MTSDPGWQRPEDAGVRPATARLVDPEDDLAATVADIAEQAGVSEATVSRVLRLGDIGRDAVRMETVRVAVEMAYEIAGP